MTIKELFDDWVEPDFAMYYLACSLGIMDYEEDVRGYYMKVTSVFNTNNKLSTMFYRMLEELVEGGVLEKKDDCDYRWNSSFKGRWEGGDAGFF